MIKQRQTTVETGQKSHTSRTPYVAPVLKWAGGKRQLLKTLKLLLPESFSFYCEPFVGGGAVFFDLLPTKGLINDINNDLIRVYRTIKTSPNKLIQELEKFSNTSECFYRVRDWDKDREKYDVLSDTIKSARTIFLNKTCYNGLFRVNKAGEFNTPFGQYRNPDIVNKPLLYAVSAYLNNADIEIQCGCYKEALKNLPNDSFVYLDPPYDPVSDTASFTGYSKCGFSRIDQIQLREECDRLNSSGIRFMLSNSATDFIKKQYAYYNITIVKARRSINSDAQKRGGVDEVVIRNYD